MQRDPETTRELMRFRLPTGLNISIDKGYLEIEGTLIRMNYWFHELSYDLYKRLAFRLHLLAQEEKGK